MTQPPGKHVDYVMMSDDDIREYRRLNFAKTYKQKRIPNTSVAGYGRDFIENFKLGCNGRDTFTNHLTQDYDWRDNDFTYDWNSYGWRGPEPDFYAKKKMLFAGGSMTLGTGVPVEKSCVYLTAEKMGYDYINMSDYDCLTELVEPLRTIGKSYDPDIICINDTRFIAESGWALNYFMNDKENKMDKQKRKYYRQMLMQTNQDILVMFESFLINTFPKAKLVFLLARNRKHFKLPPQYDKFQLIIYTPQDMIDLGRDCAHPGILSNEHFANRMVNEIE